MTKCATFLSAEAYAKNAPVRTKAIACLKGEITIETLDAVVGMADMLAEQNKQNLAAEEQAAQGATPGQTVTGSQAEAAEIKATADAIAAFWPTTKENA